MILSKLPNMGTTIFSVMSKLANENNAVNLGQGFPNFEMDPKLAERVFHYMSNGFNQYSPMPGIAELRQTLSAKIEKLYGHKYDWDTEITITAGGTQAIYTAITALIHEGDEVILFAPAYDCYAPAIELNGGKPVWVDLHYPDYTVNWESVKKLINHKTRMIVLNSPHNPSGTCLSKSDMLQLEKIVGGTDIIVLSDEVYEHIVFTEEGHQSVARFPNLVKQSLAVYSFGKTFHNTGWKMGYITGPEPYMVEFRKVHQFNVFACNTPIQYALNDYLQNDDNYLNLPDFYKSKRDIFLHAIEKSRFEFVPANGTYFQLLSYSSVSSEKDTELAIRLTKEMKIASIPCSVFYPNHLDERVLRFCFAKDEATLGQAGRILSSI
jgi:methionine transaminase